MVKLLGIDEAGRGAVIGPLVICGALIEDIDLSELSQIGVKDSKLLSPTQRESMFPEIKEVLEDFKLIKISPSEIDNLRSEGTNLNEMEAKNMTSLINKFKPDESYLDAVDQNIIKFKGRLNRFLRVNTKIIAEHAADKTYPIVSAASILAKVTRDNEIEKLKKEYGEFGSGYPSDERTKDFLSNWSKEKGRLPDIVRKSWSTVSELEALGKQKTLGDFK